MNSLFIDLFKYRERPERTPLEDWLTECLAACMRSLPSSALIALLASLTGKPEEELTQFVEQRSISIKTQHYAGDAGIPDLVLLLDDIPWILFENKVHSPVRPSQLDKYGSWLAAHDGLPWQALVFLTYTTDPPESFARETWRKLYGERLLPCSTSWARVSRKMLQLTTPADGEPDNSFFRSLVLSFHALLENERMDEDYPDNLAIAALELFVGYANPIHNLVSEMWRNVRHAAHFGSLREYAIEPWLNEGAYGAYRYVKPTLRNNHDKTFLGTGVWFPELSRWEEDAEAGSQVRPASGPQVFVSFSNEDAPDLFKTVEGMPDGEAWRRDAYGFYCHRPLSNFDAENDRRGKQIVEWCRGQANTLKDFLVHEGLTEF